MKNDKYVMVMTTATVILCGLCLLRLFGVIQEEPSTDAERLEVRRKNPYLFKKGQSGNPHGRPKKGKSFADILEKELKAQKQILKNSEGEERVIDGKTALCLAYIKLAFKGENENVRASCMEKIMKFIDGEFVQRVAMDANLTGGTVIQDVKDGLDKLTPEERENYFEMCDKISQGSEEE